MSVDSLVVGIVLSILIAELTGISPGGMVVPGYLALYLDRPLRLAGTAAVALTVYALYRLLSRRLILFGRRRFAALVLMGVLLSYASAPALAAISPDIPDMRAIGLVIPGLMADRFERQGTVRTLAMTIVVTAAVRAILEIAARV